MKTVETVPLASGYKYGNLIRCLDAYLRPNVSWEKVQECVMSGCFIKQLKQFNFLKKWWIAYL